MESGKRKAEATVGSPVPTKEVGVGSRKSEVGKRKAARPFSILRIEPGRVKKRKRSQGAPPPRAGAALAGKGPYRRRRSGSESGNRKGQRLRRIGKDSKNRPIRMKDKGSNIRPNKSEI